MPHAVEIFLKIDEFVEELMFVVQVFLNYDSAYEDLLHCSLPRSASSLLFGQQLPGLSVDSIEDDALHDCDGMTNEADSAVILVTSFRYVDKQ
ncbi:hypothetical protein DPMN_043203 [Dreissena polymorpha]|uniref:Uncharacterized protein n=1 Tax=Dreissena polymorpha TaxID=45954 RepID=A0A9D4HZF5_DREPO|nr:hypothetical protein DPMN_043203 [Dreissena polymorpha]